MLLLLSLSLATPAHAEGPPTPLVQAVMDGDGDTVGRLLEQGADPNGTWVANDGRTFREALVDFVDDSLGTPLSIIATAATGGLWPAVKGIVRGLADRRAVFTPVHVATQLAARGDEHRVAILAALLSSGGDPNLTTETEAPPLFELVSRRNGTIGPALEVLLAHGADPDAATSRGIYSRFIVSFRKDRAISDADLALLDRLHAAGARPDTGGSLCVAIERKDLALSRWLVSHGADVASVCEGGRGDTPLYVAVGSTDVDFVVWLIDQGADPDAPSRVAHGPETPIAAAFAEGDLDILAALLTAGADPNARTSGSSLTGVSPLAHALHRGDERGPWVELLIAHGADPGVVEPWGRSALSIAADDGDPEMLARLLAVPSPDPDRRTLALLMAHATASSNTRPVLEAALPPDLPIALDELPKVIDALGGAEDFVKYWDRAGSAGLADLAAPHGLLWGADGVPIELCGLDATYRPRDVRALGASPSTRLGRQTWWALGGDRLGFERPLDGGPRGLVVVEILGAEDAAACDPRVSGLLGRPHDELRLLLGPPDAHHDQQLSWDVIVGGAPARLEAADNAPGDRLVVTLTRSPG